jgi:hypothetical protein
MWAALAPYRTAGKLDATKPKDTFGLIRASKPHSCKPPGKFARVLYSIFRFPIRPDSLYRCTCRTIYILRAYQHFVWCDWVVSNEKEWRAIGGDIQDQKE